MSDSLKEPEEFSQAVEILTLRDTLFFYNNIFNKNIEVEICQILGIFEE